MAHIIAPQTGTAITLLSGQQLKVTDVKGEQVSEMVLFNAADPHEKLSTGKTFDFESTVLLSKGNYLWSNRGQKMVHITEDTNGRNDFLLGPCSRETFEINYHDADHPNCFDNLYRNLHKFSIEPDDIPTAFNIFMNVQIAPDGSLKILPPTSKAGDYVVFKAMMDLIVGLTACASEEINNEVFTPIAWEVTD